MSVRSTRQLWLPWISSSEDFPVRMSVAQESDSASREADPACGSSSCESCEESAPPPLVVVENVTSGERAWLPRVQHDLVSLGYRTEALRIGAMDVGAPHRRMRTFVLAIRLPDGSRCEGEGRGATPGERSAPAVKSNHSAMGNPPDARRRRGQLGAVPENATAARRGQGMGNAKGKGLEERGALRSHGEPQDRAPAERASLGNADGARQHESGQRQGWGRATDTGDGLADSDGDALQQQPGRKRGARGAGEAQSIQTRLPKGGGSNAERAVGRGSDGVSPGLDGHRWPAGRGEEQHDWEPPRTARRSEVPENARRLKALGNAVVPQVAELVGRRLLQLLEGP
jgi:site-specific DNA-cytosine methylase